MAVALVSLSPSDLLMQMIQNQLLFSCVSLNGRILDQSGWKLPHARSQHPTDSTGDRDDGHNTGRYPEDVPGHAMRHISVCSGHR